MYNELCLILCETKVRENYIFSKDEIELFDNLSSNSSHADHVLLKNMMSLSKKDCFVSIVYDPSGDSNSSYIMMYGNYHPITSSSSKLELEKLANKLGWFVKK